MSYGLVPQPVIFTNCIDGTATVATSASPLLLTAASPRRTIFTGSTAQTVNLPTASTIPTGTAYEFINNSSAIITIRTDIGTLLGTVNATGYYEVVCVDQLAIDAAAFTSKVYAVLDNTATPPYPTSPINEGIWYGSGTRAVTAPTSVVLGNNAAGPGANSVVIGFGANSGSGSDIIAIGSGAGSAGSTGSTNYFIGANAGSSLKFGSSNISFGSSSSQGYQYNNNITIGHGAGQNFNNTTYSTGTASQSGTTITGVGATWETFIRSGAPGLIVFSTGQQATLDSKTSPTTFSSAVSQTVPATTYVIYYGIRYNTGTASASGTVVTGAGTTFTSALVGGYIIFGTSPAVVGKISGFVSATSLIVTTPITAALSNYSIYYSNPTNNILIGSNPTVAQETSNNIVIGSSNLLFTHASTTGNAVAIGNGNSSGVGGVAIGVSCVAAVGSSSVSAGTSITPGVAIGNNCVAYGDGQGVGGVAIGTNCYAVTTGNVLMSVAIGYNAIINGGVPNGGGGLAIGTNVRVGDRSAGVGLNITAGSDCVIMRVAHTGTCGNTTTAYGRAVNATSTGCVIIGNTIESAGASNAYVGYNISDTSNTLAGASITTNSCFGRNNIRNIPSTNTVNSNVVLGHSCFDSLALTANTQFNPVNNVLLGQNIPAVMTSGSRNLLIGNGVYCHGATVDSILIGTNVTAAGTGAIRVGLNSGSGSSFTGSISGTTLTLSSAATGSFQLGMTLYLPAMNTEVTLLSLLSGVLGANGSTYTVSASLTMSDRQLRAYGNTSDDIAIGFNTLSNLYSGAGRNIAIGYNSGSTITTGDNNITIGSSAQVAPAATFATAIGTITNSVSNSVLIGANGDPLVRFEAPVSDTVVAGNVTVNSVYGVITLSGIIAAAGSADVTCNCNRIRAASIVHLTVSASPVFCIVTLRAVSAGSFQFSVLNTSPITPTAAAPVVYFSIDYPAL